MPRIRAGQITIKDPAEYNAYQMFSTQTDPKAKAAAGDSFLAKYPQSVVKKAVLDSLLDAYQQTGDSAKVLDTATSLLQVDPNNMKAILYSVMIKKQQCGQKSDAATCDDAAGLAQKGLQVTKPAETADPDWQKMTAVAYPIFHSAVALDNALSKKDFKGAQAEYTAELQLYTDDQSKSGAGRHPSVGPGVQPAGRDPGSAQGVLSVRPRMGILRRRVQGADRAQAHVLLQEVPRRPGRAGPLKSRRRTTNCPRGRSTK